MYNDVQPSEVDYFIGLDLGQTQDPSALAILERQATTRKIEEHAFSVRHLHRWPLGTSYPGIVSDVARMLAREPFRQVRFVHNVVSVVTETVQANVTLAVDATGVGRPVVDLFQQANLGAELLPITITGGDRATYDAGWRVPKRILVSTVQVALQTKRLKIAESLPEVATLVRELQNFRVTITEAANDTYGGRQGVHDDLVLAVALALWSGKQTVREWTAEEVALLDPDGAMRTSSATLNDYPNLRRRWPRTGEDLERKSLY